MINSELAKIEDLQSEYLSKFKKKPPFQWGLKKLSSELGIEYTPVKKEKKSSKKSKAKKKKVLDKKEDTNKPKRKFSDGRPERYSLELAKKVCAEFAKGQSFKRIYEDNDWAPTHSTVYGWMSKHPEFLSLYKEAKMKALDAMAEDIVHIADDATKDDMIGKHGGLLTDHENIQRSRLRIETRKWVMAKFAPKKYGEKLEIEQTNKNIDVTKLSNDELRDLIKKEEKS